MARSRQRLHDLLKQVAGNGVEVYFQPPSNIKLSFPCIKYERAGSRRSFADNQAYRSAKQYQVTVIDRDPDSALPDKVEKIEFCELDRFFAADNLNHWVFTLFF
jgi:hypothetical protein